MADLFAWRRCLQQVDAWGLSFQRQALGAAFVAAVAIYSDAETKRRFLEAWENEVGKPLRRFRTWNDVLRQSIAVVLSANPTSVREKASFYARAMVNLDRGMRAEEVAAALRALGGARKLAHETAQQRAAAKTQAQHAAVVAADDPANGASTDTSDEPADRAKDTRFGLEHHPNAQSGDHNPEQNEPTGNEPVREKPRPKVPIIEVELKPDMVDLLQAVLEGQEATITGRRLASSPTSELRFEAVTVRPTPLLDHNGLPVP